MIVYAESSAVVTLLLGEPKADAAARMLGGATRVLASTLTQIECSRAIVRGLTLGQIRRVQATALLQTLAEWNMGWDQIEIGDEVAERAVQPFPVEPVRTLDAIHLASAVVARQALGPITMVSFDERVRVNAAALGMALSPR
jgi:uncharacterized protein with PIN domain